MPADTGKERRDRKDISQFDQEATGSSTSSEPFFFFFNSFCSFALLFYERCRGYVRGAQTAPQPKQWHLGGISPGQSSNWWGRAPPQCRCWGTHFPSLPLSGSSVPHAMRCTWVFCQAGGEGDPPSSPPEIVPILTLPQCWVPIGSPSPSSA